MCVWLSMIPGIIVRPARSITLVLEPFLGRISSSLPTASMRVPVIARACAQGWFGLPVYTCPWIRSRSLAHKAGQVKTPVRSSAVSQGAGGLIEIILRQPNGKRGLDPRQEPGREANEPRSQLDRWSDLD